MSKSINSMNYSINHPALNGIIADLKILVEKFHFEFTKLREIIQELAKRLDENEICKQETICQAIKEILKEKIADGKISERYIESCLPTEYKRKHLRKKISETEICSVSQKGISIIQKDEPNNNSNYINIENGPIEARFNNKPTKNPPKLHDVEVEGCSICKNVMAENKELREIVHNNIKFHSAKTLNNGIKISKNNAQEIDNVTKRCRDFIYLIFDIEGNIIEIKADIEIDKETQENIIQANIIK